MMSLPYLLQSKMKNKLLGELYDCLYNEKIMDNRRLKRLLNIDDCTETLNKGAACWIQSRELRKEKRRK